MSNPEKKSVDDTEAEKECSNEQLSDEEEYLTREIVLGLPALSISQNFGVSSGAEEGKEEEVARLNEQAVAAAELVIAAAKEAVMKGKSDDGGSGGKQKKQKVSRPRKSTDTNDEVGSSGEAETKKPRRRASELTHPPSGPPVCNICGKGFGSWKAVFGHLRSHKDRNYQGFNPPPTFSVTAEKSTIPKVDSAFVFVTAGGGSTVDSAANVSNTSGGESGKGLNIDLNVEPVEENEEKLNEREIVAKFDLNKSPPKDEDEKEKAN